MAAFLDSNSIIALSTVLVGLFAFVIYRQQKQDAKRSAANVILLEVQLAERQAQRAAEALRLNPGSLPEQLFLMPIASWERYRNYFVRDFDRDEWDKLSDYYNSCQRYDNAVRYNNTFFEKNENELRTNIQRVLSDFARDFSIDVLNTPEEQQPQLEREYLDRRRTYIHTMLGNNTPERLYLYSPTKPINDVSALDITTSLMNRFNWDKTKALVEQID